MKDKAKTVKRIVLDLLLCAFIMTFLTSAYELYVWAGENMESDRILEELSSEINGGEEPQVIIVPVENTSSEPTDSSETGSGEEGETSSEAASKPTTYEIVYQTLYKDFDGLVARNKDTRGWIKVAGLPKLDYPFVQGKNDTYYLSHDFDKNKSSAGWVYCDNDVNFKKWNPNNMFYGHSRKNGTMFGSLHNCFLKSWYGKTSNHYVFLTTLDDELVFQIVSVYHTTIHSNYANQFFKYREAYADYLETIISRNEIPTIDYGVSPDDLLITLTTCNGGVGTPDRVALHAKLVYSKNDPTLARYRINLPSEND